MSKKVIFLSAIALYWLPKSIFINGLNVLYPSVITHSKNHYINKKKVVSLTFDDVPHNYTKEIVEKLDMHNMKATFFVISDYVNESNKRELIKMVKNGHQLGNHGKRDIMHIRLPSESLINELSECDKLIKNIYYEAGVELPHTMLYRPGSGFFSQSMINLAKTFGYVLTLGSTYPNDPIFRISYINYIYIKYHIDNGDIIILHDRKWTPLTLDYLINYMENKGFTSVTVDTLLS